MGQAQAPGTISTTSSQIGAGLLATSGAVSLINPIAGAAVAAAGGIADLVGAVSRLFQGCGQTCVQATTIVNQVEPYLIQNNQIYFTNPNRTTGDQQTALATVQQIFATVQQQCGNAALGAAGQKCINDRFGNDCAFGYTTANEYPPYCSVPYPVGVCWNWTLAYYTPILNDVPPGGAGVATSGLATTTSTGILTNADGSPNWVVIGALALIGVLLVMEA